MAGKKKYDPKFIEMIEEYFDREPYVIQKKPLVNKKTGEVIYMETEVATDFPTIAGFATMIGVNKKTIYAWAKQYEDFGYQVKKAKDYQENHLVTNGLKGLVAPAFAIFTAKNVLKWRDKLPDEASEVTVNNSVSIDDEKLKKLIKVARGESGNDTSKK